MFRHLPEKLCVPQGFFFFFALFLVLIAPVPADPSPGRPDPLPALLAESGIRKLEDHPHWLKLLHYRGSGAGRRSDIDGGYFFLSPEGREDSRAELEATLRALLSEADLSPPLDTALQSAAMHPLCKFPARLRFLRSHLDLPDSILPQVDCSRYSKWRDALRPAGATLVFASSYLNNPASTFGHTYLRLNTHSGDSLRAILNYGITYAAAVPENEGLLFVYKGVFGKYPGTYSIIPYFLTLQKYSNLESRDIWEYDLRLDSTQLQYLLEHTWEVGASWMRYYFFDENCSYNIFTLLDAADPDWRLAESLNPAAVMPSETVKLLYRENLVESRRWRPSLLTFFRLKAAALGKDQRRVLRRLLRSPPADSLSLSAQAPGMAPDSLAGAVDAALDYLQYRKRRASGDKAAPWGDRQRRLLLARAALPAGVPRVLGPDREVSPPEETHGPHLGALGFGISGYRPFAEGTYRFIHHDLNARETGFLAGSQIEALKLRLRVYCGRDCREGVQEVSVRSADVLNMVSLTSVDGFRKPISWGFRVGYDARPPGSRQAGGSMTAEGGGGFSASWQGAAGGRAFLLLQGKARAWHRAGGLVSLGPQSRAGLRLGIGEKFSLLGETRQYLPIPILGLGGLENDWSLESRISLGMNADLRIGVLNQDGIGEASFAWNGYF